MNDTLLLLAALAVAVVILLRLVPRLRMPPTHRWRRRQARAMCAELRGRDRDQPRGLIYWLKLDDRLIRELAIDRTLHTPVNFIVHTLQEVNDGLAHGRYFFMDVAKDGIALYSYDDKELHKPKPKTPKQALAMAKEYFEEWMPSAEQFLIQGNDARERGWSKKAAFEFHQATERLYHCVLLVCTFYTPHSHNIAFLRTQAERIDIRLVHAWPRETRALNARFEKLKDAYVKARYSKHYRIREETGWQVTQMDIDQRPELGQRFGVEITPTTLVIRRGSAQRMVIASGVETYASVRAMT